MKIFNIILKVILCLLLVSPILGVLGIFPGPTRDLYNTDQAFSFIQMLMDVGYINWLIAIVFLASIILIATNRTAFAAILIAPVMVNIVAFHLFLDGGLFTKGAMLANLLLILTVYFLWQNRLTYRALWNKA